MTDETQEFTWPPAAFAEQLQETSQQAASSQADLFKQFMSMNPTTPDDITDLSDIGSFGMGTAMFKSRVQSGGRISIPDAEREALDIEEGDIVQTIMIPIKRNRDTND